MNKKIFTPADVLLPCDSCDSKVWDSWSVIACDQFTSEPEYWEECAKIAEGKPSTYNFILPEAYLATDKEAAHNAVIAESMKDTSAFKCSIDDTLIYLERTLPDGTVRYGIVGKVDLEEYDYNKGSTSAVRATEATVLERIPPRCAIRAAATVELPHVMLFGDEKWSWVIGEVRDSLRHADDVTKIYDFDLMQGGGHLTGYALKGEARKTAVEAIEYYEDYRGGMTDGAVVYAVGDGNHSLAAAKAHFENLKTQLGDAAMSHPARYALVEIVSLGDSSIEFEPIYRLVKDCDAAALVQAFKAHAGCGDGGQTVTVITKDMKETVTIAEPAHALTVGSLQMFLDDYLKTNAGECDYIHGEDTTERLSMADGCVGFIFDGMEKSDLFGYVEAHGALPRKTFSMGAARTKRYYTEARKIVK
ncbi:MAG: DUF1015 domain-containing protein [Ruminococcaceae bacterium]|nr:DUF1015 domain-containing protein [Oscillospiraceae bacterium]